MNGSYAFEGDAGRPSSRTTYRHSQTYHSPPLPEYYTPRVGSYMDSIHPSALVSPPSSARSHIFDFRAAEAQPSPALLPLPSTPVQTYGKQAYAQGGYEQEYYSSSPSQACTCPSHHCSPVHNGQAQQPPTPLSARFDPSYSLASPHFTSPFASGGASQQAQNGLFEGLGDVFVSAPPPGKFRRRSAAAPLLRGPSSSSIYPRDGSPFRQLAERPRRASEQVGLARQADRFSPVILSGSFYNTSAPASPRKSSLGAVDPLNASMPYPSPFTGTSASGAQVEWPFPEPRQAQQLYAPFAQQAEMSAIDEADARLGYADPSLCSPTYEQQPRMGMYPTPSPDQSLATRSPVHRLTPTLAPPLLGAPSIASPTYAASLSLGVQSSIIDLALANRSLVPLAPPPVAPSKRGEKKRVVSRLGKVSIALDISCLSCGAEIGSLTVRGRSDASTATCTASYFCRVCKALLDSPPSDRRLSNEAEEGAGAWLVSAPAVVRDSEAGEEPTYLDSFSAALDKLSGIGVSKTFNTLPLSKSRAAILGRKSRPTSADHLTCDVCSRDIGSGSLSVSSPMGLTVRYGVEAICEGCSAKYQRCSDCGGGGGPRLGIGRWRSRELFVDGHLNCSLSHVRLGSLDEMSYEVWRLDEISSSDMEGLMARMREIYCASTIANLAIPDVLEAPRAIARTFAEVQMLASDEFSLFEHWLRSPSAVDKPRFIGLRWSTPTPRKRQPSAGSLPQDFGAPSHSRVFPEGKSLASYVLGEYDLPAGSVGVPLMAPRGSGDAYEQNTRLLEALLGRCYAHLDSLNSHSYGQTVYPELEECWSYLQHNPSSRVLNRPETKRGFTPLSDYLSEHPERDSARFPPERECLLPSELMRAWRVWARRVGRGERLEEREEGVKVGAQRRRSECEDVGERRSKRGRV